MNADLDTEALARLLDRQQIWDCLLRYVRGVDRMDFDLIRGAFWEDAHNSHGPASGDVQEFIRNWFPAQQAREVSWHMVSNQQYDFADDARSAHVETYFTAGFRVKGSPELELVGGRYADRWEKRSGEWRIANRVLLLDWAGMADATGMDARKAKRYPGTRDRTDATYERPLKPRARIETTW